MGLVKNILKISAAALSCAALTGTASATNYPQGMPLNSGEACGIQIYKAGTMGYLVAKTNLNASGSYRLSAYRTDQGNEVDIRLNGNFSAAGGAETVLSRTLYSGDIVAQGHHTDGYGATAGPYPGLTVQLDVFDRSGRVICQSNRFRTYAIDMSFGVANPSVARPVVRYNQAQSPSRANQTNRANQQPEASERAAAPRQTRRRYNGRSRYNRSRYNY